MEENSRKNRHIRKKICTAVLFLCLLLLTGCGDDGKSIYNFVGVEPKEIDPWVYLQDTALSSNTQILGFASSASRLGITIGVIGIVFSILYMAIRIFFARNAKVREEIKEEAMIKGMVAIMIFSVPFWLGIFKLAGEMLI
ncbi:MAG: hypothetical protein J1E98_08670 [Lachnospiraceae bacterium]|nr:hypothetical protein [Lachnospiraceae bacterium]